MALALGALTITQPTRFAVLCLFSLAAFLSLNALPALAAAHLGSRASITVANVQVSHDAFKAHSEPWVAENPKNPNNLIAGSKFFTNPQRYEFKIGTYYSKDGGKTWHDSGLLPGYGRFSTVSDISLAYAPNGTAYAAVLACSGDCPSEPKESGVFVSKSKDGGKTWSQPVAAYDDQSGQTFSDKPWIAVDNSAGPTRGTVYVAWNLDGLSDVSRGDPDRGKGNIAVQKHATGNQPVGLDVARSTDGGKTYSSPVIIRKFGSSFPLGAIPAVGPDARVFVVYASIDNRSGKTTSIGFVDSTNRGVSFSRPRTIETVMGLPNHLKVGNFRNFSMPSFAVSPADGSMVVTWSDIRTGDADILASTSTNGGQTWTKQVRVNNDRLRNGKDQFQPAVAVAPNGTYTLAWFDRRLDPHDRLIDEFIAQSHSDGKTWGANLRVTKKSWNPAIAAPWAEGDKNNTFIGDYQGLAVDNATVHPLWNDTQNGSSQQIRTEAIPVRLFSTR